MLSLMYLTYGSGTEQKYLIRCALDYKRLLKPKQRCSSHFVRQEEKKRTIALNPNNAYYHTTSQLCVHAFMIVHELTYWLHAVHAVLCISIDNRPMVLHPS